MTRYAIMSLSPRNDRNACMTIDICPPASTISLYATAAIWSQCQVSSNALICAPAASPVFCSKITL